ncbi:proteinase-activated receptor 1-like [Pyxicephalus adspersus]|uniref:proteinase-activated receptor 1-like n=1 Tax=Pyxicephalus adspersus TaxID=30357 RepID=UPI003B597678
MLILCFYFPDSYSWVNYLFSDSNSHWRVTRLVPTIYFVVFFVALPLNIMAIIMFLVKIKVQKPAVVYMLNLAVADVFFISILPFHIVYRFSGSIWLIGDVMCRFVTAAFYCNMYCSILLMTSISVDRFLAVVYPVQSLPWRTLNRAWLVCCAIWVISLASVITFLIKMQSLTLYELGITLCHDGYFFRNDFNYYCDYFTSVISLFFILPLFITAFCYIGIIRSLSRSKFDRTHSRSRAIILAIIVLCVFVLCFGPTNVIHLNHNLTMLKYNEYTFYIPYTLCASISSINCCLDPLIYYFASSQCRRYVYSLLRCNKDYRPPVEQKCKHQSPEKIYCVQFTRSEF